jgi:hypothetical protein
MPVMINKPAMISSFEIRFLLMIGSKIAVNKVIDDKLYSSEEKDPVAAY